MRVNSSEQEKVVTYHSECTRSICTDKPLWIWIHGHNINDRAHQGKYDGLRCDAEFSLTHCLQALVRRHCLRSSVVRRRVNIVHKWIGRKKMDSENYRSSVSLCKMQFMK